MKEKTKSSLLRFCLDAVILLIVTAGTTLVFGRTIGFEVDLSSDLIFFLGIFLIGKILIAALMDLTGFGKNFFVAAVVIGVADTIIILINSLMHFGISTRLLIFILILDVLLIAIAHVIAGIMERQTQKKQQKSEWLEEDQQTNIRDDEAMTNIYETISDGENANPELQPVSAAQKPQRPYSWEPEDTPEEDDNVAFTGLEGIDFHAQNVPEQNARDDASATSDDNQEALDAKDSKDSLEKADHRVYTELSENIADDSDSSDTHNTDNFNDASDTQNPVNNKVLEEDGDLNAQPEHSETSADETKRDETQHHEVLPFDQTETLPHVEESDTIQTETEKPEPPKTVKASYSRDTKEHLIIGPEEIVLENNNAEIIINEDDLALIRQYMKLQQSAKE